MAEAAVSFVLERLADLFDELEFHTDVHKEVERLQDELRRIRCFLRDADAKQDEDERVRNWVSDIRDVAYDAEDLIDRFIMNNDPLKKKKKNHFIKKCTSYVKGWKQRSKIAEDLMAIRSRLQDISASRETYGIQNVGEGTTAAGEILRKLRRSSPRGEERDIVGLEDDTAKLVDHLLQMGDHWSAVSIVGMGGIGKTTLGIKIYNHSAVRARFPSRAWICVSQEFSARDILQRVIRQIASPRERLEALTDEELEDLAKTENFLQIPGNENIPPLTRCRRHPIYSDSHLSCVERLSPHLRSLLFFRVVSRVRYRYFIGRNVYGFCELSGAKFDYITRNFKLLRILELEGISCSSIPSTIGELIHLSYLGLKETNIRVLPSTLGSLCNLQTLDIAGNLHLRIIPDVICNMKNLRHLYMCGHSGGHLRIDTLKHLQTLTEIDVSRWKQNNTADLVSLRKLGIRGNLCSDTIKIFDSISALLQLRSLYLRAEGAEFPLLVQLGSLRSLIKLHLRGGISQLPSQQDFPPNLSQLTLEHTQLEQESIVILEKLPKLSILRFKAESYSKEKLTISADGFPQLEFLEFNSLESLHEFNIEENAVPRLESFLIVNCKGLRMLPEEMRFVATLHKLVIEEMPKVFVDRLQGEDLHKVQHIPLIKFI
ncbi:hypothetical protein H0E87_006434 [Populus deltoides]|uniref:Uncharacterized protein n=1 Tax=Populus deltoides TaxID=3696 RepID=A0A8T2Z6U9_POPDE|nr:hypothetical protein H0E87_006434 [Populus deltoides]